MPVSTLICTRAGLFWATAACESRLAIWGFKHCNAQILIDTDIELVGTNCAQNQYGAVMPPLCAGGRPLPEVPPPSSSPH